VESFEYTVYNIYYSEESHVAAAIWPCSFLNRVF